MIMSMISVFELKNLKKILAGQPIVSMGHSKCQDDSLKHEIQLVIYKQLIEKVIYKHLIDENKHCFALSFIVSLSYIKKKQFCKKSMKHR